MHKNIALAIAGLVYAACATAIPNRQTLSWNECPTFVIPSGTRIRCAYHNVPSDWHYPDKGQVELGIAKLPAREPSVCQPYRARYLLRPG